MIAVLPPMRFVSALLFVALTGSVTLADEAKPADPKPEVARRKVPLRVVKMLPETHQVLLLDKNKGTHVLAEVGQDVDGYIVDEIADDEVTLVSDTGAEVILTAPDHGWRRKEAERKAAAARAAKAGGGPAADPAPADPYADPAEQPPAVAGDGSVRVSSAAPAGDSSAPTGEAAAPADPYEDPAIAAFAAAVGASPSPAPSPSASTPSPAPTRVATAPSTTSDASPSPVAAHASSRPAKPAAGSKATTDGASLGAAFGGGTTSTPTTPDAPAISAGAPAAAASTTGPTTATLKRAEIDAALADFSTTASSFRASFTAQGLRFEDVSSGSLLAKAGLQKGDVVTTVDGQPLRSLDDAANLYARLPTARGTTLAVVRAGKPVILRVAIQ